jgi:aspartate kinase
MQELAEHGARVINAQAVEWARHARIVIRARATDGAGDGNGGETRVGGVDPERRGALAVTGTRRVTQVAGGRRVLALLAEERVALRQAQPGLVRLVRDDVPDWPRVERRLVDDGARVTEEGAVTVVGPGVGADAAAIARALEAAQAPLGFDSTPLRLTVYVAPDAVDEVTRRLHAALC